MLKHTLLAAAALIVATPAVAQMADPQFRAIADKEWAWRNAEGIADRAPGTVEDHFPDISPAAQARRQSYWSDVLKQLDAVDQKSLSPATLVDFQVYRAQVARLLDDQKFLEWQMPLNSDSAFWSGVQYGARGDFQKGEPDYRAYLARLADIPRFFDQESANMAAGAARGFTPPKAVMGGRDSSIVATAEATDPTATVFYEPFKKLPATMPQATRDALQAEAKATITTKVIPAYQKLLTFYRTQYAPKMRATLGAYAYKDGKAYYASRIRAYTTLDTPAEDIHAFGLSEVARIHARMLDVMKQTGFKGDFPAFLEFLRTDPQFAAKTPDELLKDAAWIAKKFDKVSGKWFGRLPRQRFGIIPVPPEIAPFYTAGRGGPGTYLLNTFDLPSRRLYSLPALTLHESAPGHAFQIPLAAENTGLPDWRRYDYISAYGEGWALYTELLGEEMGIYENPYEVFGMLSYQMWRACRLVVDTGIHAKGWTRDQAVKFMRDNTALSDREIGTEIDRYIGWPGQALSYYIGEQVIVKARAKAEKALGPKFDIRAFHDTVLSLGAVPMPVLEARIDRFIAEGGKGPYDTAASDK